MFLRSVFLRSVYGKSLRDGRRALLGWVIGITATAAVYGSFYPTYRQPGMVESIERFPAGLMRVAGVQDLGSPAGYLQSTVFGLVVPLLAVVFAIALGSRAVAGDEEAGTMELVLAHPVARARLVLERFAAMVTALVLVGVAVFAVMLVVDRLTGLDLPSSRLGAAAVHLVLLALCFGTLALAAGAVTGERGPVLAVTAGLAVLSYLANTLAVDWLPWARHASVFFYYSGGQPLRHGIRWGDAGVLVVVSVVLLAVALVAFDRRDVGR